MDIAILLFDRMTALDAIGPYEVLANLPGANIKFVGETTGVKRTEHRSLGLSADFSVADVASADILVIPGGFGEEDVRAKPSMLEWVSAMHATTKWTTSVCTGALILGAAGILNGLDATTHWASRDILRQFGANPVKERVVERGKIITAAGVSSGIDMGLWLARRIAGDDVAHAIQIGIEYDPEPPFDGTFENAPAPVASFLMKLYARRLKQSAEARSHS
jgi:putative intracellular protease/amidase